MPELTNRPAFPEQASYVWRWFIDLMAINKVITYTEVKAWSDITGKNAKAWEVEAIMALELLRRKHG